MRNIFKISNKLIKEKNELQYVINITIIFLLLLAVSIFSGLKENSKYILDEKGNVVAIKTNRDYKTGYEFNIKAIENGICTNHEEILNINRKENSNKKTKSSSKETVNSNREREIEKLLYSMENTNKKIISIPQTTESGIKLIWKKKEKNKYDMVILFIFYIFIITLIVQKDKIGQIKKNKKIREDILIELPSFVSKLVLMLEAGLIMQNAVEEIISGYKKTPNIKRTIFQNELINIWNKNYYTKSTGKFMIEVAENFKVKELLRISIILDEGERKGGNIIEKLESESKYLWENRKIIAIEKGKLIDMKMVYPMGILLIILIMITMAPAILTM